MEEQGYEPDVTPFDGIIHRNVVDDISFQSAIPHNQYVVFDPSQIRSTAAEFDPSRSRSADIMAGFVPLAAGEEYRKNALSDNNRSK